LVSLQPKVEERLNTADKAEIVERLVRDKFRRSKELRERLVAT